MELSPFVHHHHHHHGKKGRGGGVADLWDVIDPLEIALTVLEEDAPRRARARYRRAIANTNVDWVEIRKHTFSRSICQVSHHHQYRCSGSDLLATLLQFVELFVHVCVRDESEWLQIRGLYCTLRPARLFFYCRKLSFLYEITSFTIA